ncbi:MAG: histidine triad nucleotide-binding protein [Clostridiales bacterium]|nr:histidine triad nucleotide-binding protein [Clostridiales bacterium]MDY2836305.1 histidine triad nucleotide-binding protein [Candidatus Aphodomonas sp.]
MEDCIFCKIARGEIPSSKVYEDEQVVAFNDLNPQAPVHVLIVPKAHYANLNEAGGMPEALLAALLRAASRIAAQLGLDKSGYRIVSNCGPDACQSVQHLHIHLLGGAKLAEKMS